MTVIESTPQRLVVQSGSRLNQTTLTLDKSDLRASIERVVLFWRRKPLELHLADIDDVAVAGVKDPASGAETYQPVVHARTGQIIVLPGGDKEDAEDTADHVRSFLGLH